MKRKSVFMIGSLVAAIISIFTALGSYYLITSTKKTIMVPVVKTADGGKISKGDKITDIGYVEVNPSILNVEDIVLDPNDLIGNYALRDMNPNEFFYSKWVSTDYYKRLAERAVYGAVPAPTSQITSVNGEVKENDFVMLSIITGGDQDQKVYDGDITSDQLPTGSVNLIEPAELSAVRVLGVYSGSGIDINDIRDTVVQANGSVSPDSSLAQPSFIVFDANAVQRAMILQAQHSGTIQLTILPEAVQEQYRQEWGLDKTEEDTTLKLTNGKAGAVTGNTDNIATSKMSDEEIAKRQQELIAKKNEEMNANAEKVAKDAGTTLTDSDKQKLGIDVNPNARVESDTTTETTTSN